MKNKQKEKPAVKLTGQDGNVFNLIGLCSKALNNAGMPEKSQELCAKIFASKSYSEALSIMSEYCEVQ